MKNILLFICCFIAVAMCNSCDTDKEREKEKEKVIKTEGAVTLDMSEPNARIDGRISLVEGNFTGALFTTMGKVNGLGNIKTIPKKEWANNIAAIEGHGYIAYYNNQYLRFYVNTYKNSRSIVEYQRPFLGSEREIKPNKNAVTVTDNPSDIQILEFTNGSLFPFTISVPQSDNWFNASIASLENNSPPNIIRIAGRERNPTTTARESTLTIKSDINEKEVPIKVIQAGDAWITADREQVNLSGNSQNVSISSNATWTATSNTDWCIISPNYGTGNGTIAVSATPNTTGAFRNAVITVSTQDNKAKTEINAVQPASSLSVSRNNISFSAPATQNTFTVSSNASWTVSSDKDWCVVFVNNNTVTVAVTTNLTGLDRNATVTVEVSEELKATVNITQAKPTLSVSNSNISLAGTQSQSSFNVTSNISTWTVSSDQTWCTVVRNNNQITVSATENLSGTARTATVKVALSEQHYTEVSVTQAIPTLSVSSSDISLAGNQSSDFFTVSSNNSLWTVSSNQTWCTVVRDNNRVNITATENLSGATRTATLRVALSEQHYTTVTITQALPTLSVSSSNISLSGNQSSETFTVTSNISTWTVSSNQTWCTVVRNNNQVNISVTENLSGAARTATVRVTLSEQHYLNATVTQAMPTLSVSVSELTFPKTPTNNGTITVTSDVSSWNVLSNQSWCTVSKSGNNVIVSTSQNTTGVVRQATITISLPNTNRTITVRQGSFAVGDYYNVNGVRGVVYKMIDDFRGMIVSLDEAQRVWGVESVSTGATSRTDGLFNMERIKLIPNWNTLYPAFAWVDAKNTGGITGWYLPVYSEIVDIFSVRNQINTVILSNGGMQINLDNIYWSSTENGSTRAYAYASWWVETSNSKNTSTPSYARSVRAF